MTRHGRLDLHLPRPFCTSLRLLLPSSPPQIPPSAIAGCLNPPSAVHIHQLIVPSIPSSTFNRTLPNHRCRWTFRLRSRLKTETPPPLELEQEVDLCPPSGRGDQEKTGKEVRRDRCSWPDCTKPHGILNRLNRHVVIQKYGSRGFLQVRTASPLDLRFIPEDSNRSPFRVRRVTKTVAEEGSLPLR